MYERGSNTRFPSVGERNIKVRRWVVIIFQGIFFLNKKFHEEPNRGASFGGTKFVMTSLRKRDFFCIANQVAVLLKSLASTPLVSISAVRVQHTDGKGF